MKVIRGAILISSVLMLSLQPADKNKILWSADSFLQWKDFTGRVKKAGYAKALTTSYIEYKTENGKPGVFTYFVKNESWYVKKSASDYILQHEQYHFHLTEEYARKLRKQIIEGTLTKDVKKLEKAFNNKMRDLATAQRKYDKETNHSINVEAQARWQKEIDAQLAELDDFSNPLVER